ncbi:TetR/AcrR family transcriptional regulator [Agrococcus baldri]|uniref:TetR family transcriptional regulator n=1 Tax=Agrococcus baldri TaxID=153730 RepID=A0AA87RBV3_9MICO|nr:TetR/AcrR family transcriptional regulator [Agrococcus baldri]GEK80209.1 TetR family transcriptional regulator [Agrococcus baldri]
MSEQQAVRRADAQRNIERILDAAAVRLSRDPDASVAAIAAEAGLGRVTVYGHFPTRGALVAAVVERAIAEGDAALEAVDLTGDPRAALVRLIEQSWLSLQQIGALSAAAASALPPERLLALHERPAARVERLLERGQRDGVFRADLPLPWLTGTLHRAIHGAAGEIDARRMTADDAPELIAATVLAALTPPGGTVPAVHDWRHP